MMPLEQVRKEILLVHSLPLPAQRHRARIQWMPALCALATCAYVLFWLTRHSFMEHPHHYLTALVIVGWLAVLPFVAFYTHERSKHHGLG